MIFNPDALHLYRRRLRLTLKGLAGRAGMTVDMIFRIENGLKLPTKEHLSALAVALDVSEHSPIPLSDQNDSAVLVTPLGAIQPPTRTGYAPADRPKAPSADSMRPPVGSVMHAWIEQISEGPKLLFILASRDIFKLVEAPADIGV